MDSVDISDLAFSLGNFSAVNELLSSTTENISNVVNEIVPDFVSESIPNFVPESIPENIIPGVLNTDNNFFLYLGIGLVVIAIGLIFAYNYFVKNKSVQFQDNVENYYQEPQPSYQDPQPNYQDPQPNYQEPQPNYQEPQPSYQQSSSNYQQSDF